MTYTIDEVSTLLGVSIPTVRNWIGQGLPVLKSRRPYLVVGAALKEFLENRLSKRKSKLQLDQLYCLSCKQARIPYGHMVDFVPQTAKTGRLVGLCPHCEATCNRMISRAKINDYEAVFDIVNREPEQA